MFSSRFKVNECLMFDCLVFMGNIVRPKIYEASINGIIQIKLIKPFTKELSLIVVPVWVKLPKV